jgi:hypothetical protein
MKIVLKQTPILQRVAMFGICMCGYTVMRGVMTEASLAIH